LSYSPFNKLLYAQTTHINKQLQLVV